MGSEASIPTSDSGKRQAVIANERAKLLANALDRASTACVTVGVLGPTAAALYGLGQVVFGGHGFLFALGAFSWLTAAALLHMMARQVLGRIR
jgi:hypothetical protein